VLKVDGAIGKAIIAKQSVARASVKTENPKKKGAKPKKPAITKPTTVSKIPTHKQIISVLGSTDTDSEIVSKLRDLYGIKKNTQTKFTDLPPELHKLIFVGASPTSSKSLMTITKGVNKSLKDDSVWITKIKNEFGNDVKIKKGDSPFEAYKKLIRYRYFIRKAISINRKQASRIVFFITKQSFLEKFFQLKDKNMKKYNSYDTFALKSVDREHADIGSAFDGSTKPEKDKEVITKLSIMMYNGKLFLVEKSYYGDVSSEGIPSGDLKLLKRQDKQKRSKK